MRRPALDRTEPRRGWGNLYAPGKADAAGAGASTPPTDEASEAPVESEQRQAASTPVDAAARVVRDGYRIVEENLRRGRQVAAELRGVQREVARFAGRIDAEQLLGDVTRTVIDPALTAQVVSVARSFFDALGAVVPGMASTATPAAGPTTAPQPAAQVALHPQQRPDYVPGGARILKLRSTGPGEWLADLELDGQVRRVQVRAVDGEL